MRITQQLIRQKTEHHDGILDELEEIALHQLEIEKIENIDKCCRHLKILLLQNNLIEKIENVRKMKELEYLNLALNNISKIENLEGCECLRKLDLTVNFVDLNNLEESLLNLRENERLRDLYLMGNPCTEWPNFRLFAVANLPQLTQLDGKIITPTERIEARRELPRLKRELVEKIEEQRAKSPVTSSTAYTIENRKKMYLEMAKEREAKETSKDKQQTKQHREPPSVYNEKGEIRQCNQGRYDFVLDQTSEPEKIILEIKTPKYLCSAAIDVDLHPTYVRCLIKDKLTQLRLPAEISVEGSQVKHSKVTGHLRLEMPLLDPPFEKGKGQSQALKRRQNKDVHSPARESTTSTCVRLGFVSSSRAVNGSRHQEIVDLREISKRTGAFVKSSSLDQIDNAETTVEEEQRSKTEHNQQVKKAGSSKGDKDTMISTSPFGTSSTAADVDDDLPDLETVL